MNPTNAVVAIPVKNNLHYTQPLVVSLLAQNEVKPNNILIYDNGSDDETSSVMQSFGVQVINAAGWRLHQMWNDALSRNSGSPVAILNNDIEIGSNFISAMIAALESDKSLAVVCPNYDGRDEEISYVADIQAGRMDGTGGIAGWAYMIPADWADSFRFPEELTWWYGDNVLVDSIIMAGRRCGITGSTTVIHLDGGSKTGNWTGEMVEPDRVWYEQWRSDFSA